MLGILHMLAWHFEHMVQAKRAGASLMHPDALAALPGVGQNAITRRAGGRLSNKPQPKCVVIDVREFMGSLPAVLHQQGLQIVPVTLEVRTQLSALWSGTGPHNT